MVKKIIQRLRAFLSRKYYIVGFVDKRDVHYDGTHTAHNVQWIKYPGHKKDWIADPFILDSDEDYITILAEQWIDSIKKGRLVRLKISRHNYKVVDFATILEASTHLSFPIIFREDGVIYVCPENYESGALSVYQYNVERNILENPTPIINEPLLDPQIIKIGSLYYLFAIKYEGRSEENKTLYIYKAPSITGPYNLMQTMDSKSCAERGAGSIIYVDGRIIRPAQNCEGGYGKSVIFKELRLKDDKFYEQEIGSLLPSRAYPEGLHTYNEVDDIAVIDGIAYNCGNIITFVRNIIKA